jgi:NTP pyrophosphatase (non-canonical NTP hydrolase)
MTDAQFLYQLMLRVQEARAKHPATPLWALTEEVTELHREMEEGKDADRKRDEALDVACVALRIAVEVVKG